MGQRRPETAFRRRGVVAAVLGLAGLLAACGGDDAPPPPPPDPCAVAPDPEPRDRMGTVVSRRDVAPVFAIAPLPGRVWRNGDLSRLYFDDHTFRTERDPATGGYRGLRGASLTPLPALETGQADMLAFDITYAPGGGATFHGQLVIGPETPPSQMARVGGATYRGTVALELARYADGPGDPVTHVGAVTVTAGFGTRRADVVVSGLTAAKATDGPALAGVEWRNLAICAARVSSDGAGVFTLKGAGGAPVNPVGPAKDAPGGAAILDARFYGAPVDGAPPAIGGAILITGDHGAVSGVFTAIRAHPGEDN